jgi:tRNA-5-methyluridine54 2-sulfurtransferase
MNDAFAQFPPGAKCTRCKEPPSIRLTSHHAILCPDCFLHYFRTAVRRAMKKFGTGADQPLLVAVSGGKDSLALWNVLHELGYPTKGLHINLGIEVFSRASRETIERFARNRQLGWAEYSIQQELGYSLPEIAKGTRRKICSVCGTVKRQLLNRLTVREGFSCLAIGHNLDDEAGRLLGNMVRHRTQYLEKQYPFLPSTHPRLPAKLKPLYRLESHEIRTYCKLADITPVDAKCPFSRGATSHVFKEALHFLEGKMPGTKRDFLFTFLGQRKPPQPDSPYELCRVCGEPAYGNLCSVCNLLSERKEQRDKMEEMRSEGRDEWKKKRPR